MAEFAVSSPEGPAPMCADRPSRTGLARAIALAVVASACWCAVATAETSLRVVATDPASPSTLGKWQRLSLRIGYSSDRPVLFRAQPFFAGKPVPAVTGGSPLYDAGSG